MSEQIPGQVFTWSMAEELAVAHLRTIGFPDAQRTRTGADGGIDAQATSLVAQVKHHAQPVGAPDVQRIRGAGHEADCIVFYSSSGYTPAAIAFAEHSGVALFTYTASNVVASANAHADQLERTASDRGSSLTRLIVGLRASAARLKALETSAAAAQEAVRSTSTEGITDAQVSRVKRSIRDLEAFRDEVHETNPLTESCTARLNTAIAAVSEDTTDDESHAIAQEILESSTWLHETTMLLRTKQVVLLKELALAIGVESSALIDPTPADG